MYVRQCEHDGWWAKHRLEAYVQLLWWWHKVKVRHPGDEDYFGT